jgi:hypothetical protein
LVEKRELRQRKKKINYKNIEFMEEVPVTNKLSNK